MDLSPEQLDACAEFRSFVEREVSPRAACIDREERIAPELIRLLAERGYLGAALPAEHGGRGMDPITYGLLHEEFGRGSASVEGVLNVHTMAAQAIFKWGNRLHRSHWIPKLAAGESLAAFAITEPTVGSDAKSVETSAAPAGDGWVLNGRKKWITCGQVADVFLVLAQCEGQPSAFLVERGTPGFSTRAISGLLGCRGYMLAEVSLQDCRLPRENLVGRVGFGLTHVAATGLDAGRYGLAWSCVGLAQACLDACIDYTSARRQFGACLRDHELIQRMITRMITGTKAARLLCCRAGYLRERRHPASIMETSIAKYFASTTLQRISNDAVQITAQTAVAAITRSTLHARREIMEIIEGTTQIRRSSSPSTDTSSMARDGSGIVIATPRRAWREDSRHRRRRPARAPRAGGERNAVSCDAPSPGVFRCTDIARACGVCLRDVIKTLVVRVPEGRFVLTVLPGDMLLSLPKVARVLGCTAASMAAPEEAVAVTGFEIGGITPLGCARRNVPVVADYALMALGTVNVGGGRAHVGIELQAAALLDACRATLADIGRHPSAGLGTAPNGKESSPCASIRPTT
jgi:Cys-tRNA(Pro) deacylase